MMGALAEIQRKGDTMLAGIRRQREVLDRLERKAELAEKRREQAEILAKQMESEKQKLEDEVLELKYLKDSMMTEMQEEEVEMSRLGIMITTMIIFIVYQSEVRAGPPDVPGLGEEVRVGQIRDKYCS